MLSTFCAHLDSVGLLGHTLLLTTDSKTWHTLHARGLPVYLGALETQPACMALARQRSQSPPAPPADAAAPADASTALLPADRAFPERQEFRDGKGHAPDTPNR